MQEETAVPVGEFLPDAAIDEITGKIVFRPGDLELESGRGKPFFDLIERRHEAFGLEDDPFEEPAS